MSILWHDILFVIIFEIQRKEESTFIDYYNIVNIYVFFVCFLLKKLYNYIYI